MKNLLAFSVLVIGLTAYSAEKPPENPTEQPADKPAAKPKLVTRVGVLPKPQDILQHPLVTLPADIELPTEIAKDIPRLKQFYFDVEVQGKQNWQIIVVYPADMKIPTEHDRKIELTGSIKRFSLGGAKQTKGEYSNDILTLHSWKYLDKE